MEFRSVALHLLVRGQAQTARAARRGPSGSWRKWRNWQTHQLEGLAVATSWGFKSPLPHQYPTHSKAPRVTLSGAAARNA